MFKNVNEARITRAIISEFTTWLHDYVASDVIIIGGGPSGLFAAKYISEKGYKTLIVESNNYLGGGFWIGGYLMNTLTFRSPSESILNELGIRYKKQGEGLVTALGPEACSKLIAATCDAGAKILNMTKFDDVVLRNNKVEGAVVNWTPVSALPRAITCVDPIALESKILIDATGHDAWVCKSLEKRKLLEINTYGPMDVCGSEDILVENTGEIYPGLIACGMSVSTAYGIPRMGPTFGGMLYSGKKAGELAIKMLAGKESSTLKKEKVVA